MDINEVFGKKVLERRLSLKISQETLANMADIDRTYLPDIEKGKRNVSLRVADKIAKALNVSLNTVKMHLQNIYRKNNLKGRIQLMSSY